MNLHRGLHPRKRRRIASQARRSALAQPVRVDPDPAPERFDPFFDHLDQDDVDDGYLLFNAARAALTVNVLNLMPLDLPGTGSPGESPGPTAEPDRVPAGAEKGWSWMYAARYAPHGPEMTQERDSAFREFRSHPLFQRRYHPRVEPGIRFLAWFAAINRPFWVRSFASWRPVGRGPLEQLCSLVEHLLVRYPVPEWIRPWRQICIAARRPSLMSLYEEVGFWFLFLGLAQGWKAQQALRALLFDREPRPRQLATHLWEIPVGIGLPDAINWLTARAAGIPAEHAGAFLSYPVWNGMLLLESFARLLRRCPELTSHLPLVWSWGYHLNLEAGPTSQFTFDGRSGARLLRDARAYQRQIHTLSRGSTSWSPLGVGTTMERDGVSWCFVELCSHGELARESRSMRHCVVFYAQACAWGTCRIVSLRRAGAPALTVEIRMPDRAVVQARGWANAQPTPEEHSVLRAWCDAQRLRFERW